MEYLDQRYYRKETKLRRNYEIEESLFHGLQELTAAYDVTLSELLNFCIAYLIKTEHLTMYFKPENSYAYIHTFQIRISNLNGLDDLKERYGISIQRLVHIAVNNVLEDYKKLNKLKQALSD